MATGLTSINRETSPAGPGHVLQFYQTEPFIVHAAASFLAAGLFGGEHLLVVTDRPRWEVIRRDLVGRGFDVSALRRAGRVVWLDAREMLLRLMTGSMPDATRFNQTIGPLLASRLSEGKPIRMYGDMVDILVAGANANAAIGLERLWERHLSSGGASLMCGYFIGSFEGRQDMLDGVCGRHDHVVPADEYGRLEDGERRQREIVSLQLQARALQAEMRQREELATALREILADRERLLDLERNARAAAEAANRAKDDFLGVLSHELRTPLNAILGWLHLIDTPGIDPVRKARALDVIRRNALLQKGVVDDLLEMSRILAGRLPLRAEAIDLVAAVTAAVDDARSTGAARAIEVDLQVDGGVVRVTGDPVRLQQAVSNLLANAVKFSPERGHVRVRLTRVESRVRLFVEDSGEGIDPEFLPYVFDRFRQQDTGLARRHGGLGVGLAITRYIVEAHGGTVSAASDGNGRGAVFTIELPLARAA